MATSKFPILQGLRLIPRDKPFLDRKSGLRGEIFYDSDLHTLRVYEKDQVGGDLVLTQDTVNTNLPDSGVSTLIKTITVARNSSDTANVYYINGSEAPTINFVRGYTYVFDQSDSSNVTFGGANPHPLKFEKEDDTAYTTKVYHTLNGVIVTYANYVAKFRTATSRKVYITPLTDTPEILKYVCEYHLGMGNNITVADPGTGSGNSSSSGGGSFEFNIAADDSTQQIVTEGNTIQFVGGSGITTTATADGVVTITNTANAATAFTTIAVDGQNNVVADTSTDTLTLVAGSNVTITTDDTTDTITINADASGAASNSFSTFAVSGEDSVVADTSTDTLTLVAGSGIAITTNSGTDTITITNQAVSQLSSLSDVSTASLTVDKFYLPAITSLTVTNNGASSYRFDQYGTTDNPTIYAINGTTIAFNLNSSGHPFLIQTGAGTNYNDGLYHVDTNGNVSTGSNAQGKTSGTLYFKIPQSISGGYRYQCSVHAPMVGSLTIKNIQTI